MAELSQRSFVKDTQISVDKLELWMWYLGTIALS
jgi:hypothetical protein